MKTERENKFWKNGRSLSFNPPPYISNGTYQLGEKPSTFYDYGIQRRVELDSKLLSETEDESFIECLKKRYKN